MTVPKEIPLSAAVAVSKAVARIPGLASFLGAKVVRSVPTERNGSDVAVLGWGRKPSAAKAAALARRHGLPLVRLEDGFLRSVAPGTEEPPLSIILDDLGVYYDASAPSRLEVLISAPHDEEQRLRATRMMESWRQGRVSKYNHAREHAWPNGRPGNFVLVADQTRGDASIKYGRADAASFPRMLQAALEENPDCAVFLKVHPSVIAGKKEGHFDSAAAARDRRVVVLAGDAHPVSLLEHARAVYTVSSQLGFEGLLWGKRVRTFGMPFYAGWGLTHDDLSAPDRRTPVLLEDLVYAALVEYSRYRDPETGARCEAERAIEWMSLQRRMRERFPGRVHARGFSPWKRPIVRHFFQGSNVTFLRRADPVPKDATLVVWGRAAVEPQRAGGRTVRLEDGFLRSVGLGADLVRPLSWIADGSGMYYDATGPSDLERLLGTAQFDDELTARARALRERIVSLDLTKYNDSGRTWQLPGDRNKVILVPGQVETDASIRYAAPGIRTNIDLLRAVRRENPDAYLVYKPHPDVVARLRRRGAGEREAVRWCDEVVADASMGRLLSAVDEVHVLTSLAGFEALLRGKRVVTYGHPFYAGWGLTEDRHPVAGRGRSLNLDELIAGVLITYPIYVSRTTGRYTTPERTLDELQTWRNQRDGFHLWIRPLQRAVLSLWDRLR